MSHRLLVYGTLKRNQPNHSIVTDTAGNCRYLGQGVTVEKWPLVVASQYHIPFFLDVKGVGQNVRGEVYEVDNYKLKVFDDFENHPAYYTRVPIMVQMITDSEDKPLDAKPFPEEIEVYLVKNPKMELLSLEHLENYEPDGVIHPYFNLPQEMAANLQIWKDFFRRIKYMSL